MNTEQRENAQWRFFVNEYGLEQGQRVKYLVLRAESLDELQGLVNWFIEDGYKPSGSLIKCENPSEWIQPVVFDRQDGWRDAITGKGFVAGIKTT